jgi:hypothetical protein
MFFGLTVSVQLGPSLTPIALADIRCEPGIIYFVLMFREYFPPFLDASLEQITFSCRCSEHWSDYRSLGEPVFD